MAKGEVDEWRDNSRARWMRVKAIHQLRSWSGGQERSEKERNEETKKRERKNSRGSPTSNTKSISAHDEPRLLHWGPDQYGVDDDLNVHWTSATSW